MKHLAVILAALLATPALAQQALDPTFMQKAITVLQAQRNAALDGQAAAEARANMLAEEVAALKKQIEDANKPADQGQARPK